MLIPVGLILLLLGISVISSRRERPQVVSDSAILMDTIAEISLWGKGEVDAQAAIDSAFNSVRQIDSLFHHGLVSLRWQSLAQEPREMRAIMRLADSVYNLTSGCFDPTIGSVSRLWQFDEHATPPEPESLRVALSLVGLPKMKQQPSKPFLLDVRGVAKGYAVDAATEKLRKLGFTSAIINAGGDLRVLGRRPDGKPWRIAIRHPRRPGDLIGYVDVEDCAVATSGDYERFFIYQGKRYHHILDPRSGMPARTCESVTVMAPSAALADALATGLFVLGPQAGLRLTQVLDGVEAVFIYAEGDSIKLSRGIEGRFRRLGDD